MSVRLGRNYYIILLFRVISFYKKTLRFIDMYLESYSVQMQQVQEQRKLRKIQFSNIITNILNLLLFCVLPTFYL